MLRRWGAVRPGRDGCPTAWAATGAGTTTATAAMECETESSEAFVSLCPELTGKGTGVRDD